ncbi:hypothetical protein WJX72_003517 [[Myrmecia] bisecta]|uniref:J domain-containing protein n=1 Tax=[Myrmecia] bisecta TaxID=41462 RepID=A0AAW1PWX1_9CHLO
MGVETDYYAVLGLSRNATDIDIKKAYRKLALKYHPDNNTDEAARGSFASVCEAYDVLSEPTRKGFYDLYGESALKKGLPDGQGGRKGGDYSFDAATAPQHMFAKFFGTSNPYEALNELAAQYESLSSPHKLKPGKHKTYTVAVSLEEVYHGCTKKVQHTRKVLQASGGLQTVDSELVIDVRAGLPNGTRFVFEGEGNQTPTTEPGPVIFVLQTLDHECFGRQGADLLYTATIPLHQALCGANVTVDMLDGRTLTVPVTDIVTSGQTITVPNEGLPKLKGGKGDLIVKFDVLFPSALSEAQRMLLKAAFFLPQHLSNEQAKAVKAFERAFRDKHGGWSTAFPKADTH